MTYKLYLIYAETEGIGQWKIGVTGRDIEWRINELLVANPNIIGHKALYDVGQDKELAYRIETALKRYLRPHKIKGEWIEYEALNKDKFLELCEKCKNSQMIAIEIEKSIKEHKKYDNNTKTSRFN